MAHAGRGHRCRWISWRKVVLEAWWLVSTRYHVDIVVVVPRWFDLALHIVQSPLRRFKCGPSLVIIVETFNYGQVCAQSHQHSQQWHAMQARMCGRAVTQKSGHSVHLYFQEKLCCDPLPHPCFGDSTSVWHARNSDHQAGHGKATNEQMNWWWINTRLTKSLNGV